MNHEKDIVMDTEVFTDIVNNIANAAIMCKPDIDTVLSSEQTLGTDIMKKLSKYSEEAYDTSIMFSSQAGETLPFALEILRDSIILQDKKASEALEINESRK